MGINRHQKGTVKIFKVPSTIQFLDGACFHLVNCEITNEEKTGYVIVNKLEMIHIFC